MFALHLLFILIYSTLQQCPSEGVDYSANQVSNGNFETPVIGTGNPPQTFAGGIGAWTCTLAQIGNGVDYNSNWGTTQVAALDTGSNQYYTQSFSIAYQGRFFFSIDFTKRQGFSPSTSGLRIYWNGKNVAQQPTSSDDLIHSITLNLTSNQGVNTIIIQAMGHDDGEGTTIDNIGVYPIVQYNRAIINGVCGCNAGYFDNGYNYPCVACSDMVQFCAQCTFIANLSLLSANCLANIDSGAACSNGTFACTACLSGYYVASTGLCQPIQIIPGFYQPNWQLQYVSCNKFTAQIQITLSSFSAYSHLTTNNTNVAIAQSSLSSNGIPDTYIVKLEAQYLQDISEQTIAFIVSFIDASGNTDTAATIIKMSASDIPLVKYTDGECSSIQHIDGFAISLVVISYIVMFFSSISLKIVGLQLFGVLQLAFFSLASHDKVNLYLQPFLKWKYVNGYNVETAQPSMNVSNSINLMGYKDNFFFNINFMFALLLLDLIVGAILYQVAKYKQNQRLKTISLYVLKLGFITLFLFNSLNLSFSIGTHFKYANPQTTDYYGIGTLGAILGVLAYIFAALYMQLVGQKQFGEYKNKFKKNCVNKFYIPLSIIYRFILGLYIAEENEWYLGTLVILGASISFIMFNIINLPFKKAYQNYRANLCHFSQLVILFVSNYYRSMKHNTDLNEKGRIYWPAILEIVMVCLCIVVSTVCLVYEIVRIIKEYRAEIKGREKITGDSDKADKVDKIGPNELSINKTEQQIVNEI